MFYILFVQGGHVRYKFTQSKGVQDSFTQICRLVPSHKQVRIKILYPLTFMLFRFCLGWLGDNVGWISFACT